MTNHTIYRLEYQTRIPDSGRPCSFCGKRIEIADATAGPCDLSGMVTYICSKHLRDPRQFINLLADFMATQRFALAQNLNYQKLNANEGDPDVWFLH